MAPPPKTRHWAIALFLHIGIRVRYWLTSFFGLKALLSPLTAYPSPFRPKNCPKYDLITRISFISCWFFTACTRDCYGLVYMLFLKLGIMNLVSMFHKWASDRLIAQMKANGYTSAQRKMPIPEYDWQNGDPETFFQTFATRPHPVILRGFMKNTQLLKDLNWDTVLSRFGEEEVYLTTRQMDGTPGKLKEVNNPRVYLHNSEKLFNKFPEMRYGAVCVTSLYVSFPQRRLLTLVTLWLFGLFLSHTYISLSCCLAGICSNTSASSPTCT
jgi:hypothetical protein